MAGVELERQYVAALYPGPRWKRKVAHMPDSQVLAIYFREKQKAADHAAKAQEPPKESSDDERIPF